MVRRGYTYYDWNVSAQDAVSPPRTKAQIVESVLSGVHNSKWSVVLMHDSDKRETSIYAVDTIVKTLQDEGYSFLPLNKNVVPVDFAY